MADANPPTSTESSELRWQDARGHVWMLHATAQTLRLAGPDEEITLPSSDWDSHIDYNVAAGRVVFRFDLADRQVGFMVSSEQADLLLERMNWSNARAVASADRHRAQTQRVHDWPTVTPWSIAGLFAAALAFLPVAGPAFAVMAIACAVSSVLRMKRDPRLIHGSTIAAATITILVISSSAYLLSLLLRYGPSRQDINLYHGAISTSLTTVNIVVALIIVLLSLSVHEAAHALMAWWCGDLGPLRQGRVTLNPIAHIDPVGTILVPAVLAYWGGAVFGWAKPVMVSLHNVPNPRRANLLVSAAGPLSNLLLGLIFLSLYLILGCCVRLWLPQAEVLNFTNPSANVYMSGFAGAQYLALVTVFLKWGLLINFLLLFFNLIPIPPLDGGHIAASLFPNTVAELYRRLGHFTTLILLGLVATGLIGKLLWPGIFATMLAIDLVHSTTGL